MSQTYELTLRMRVYRFILGLFGWRVVRNVPPTNKYVLVGAWHTSNWDFPLAILAVGGMGVPLNFIGKQELLRGPLGGLMQRLGVIGVDRAKTKNFTQKIAELYKTKNELRILVPAEGTRSRAEYWRTGFYYMALEANIPIAFAVLDAGTKTIGIDGYFVPTGNRDEDFKKVIDFYKDKRGLKPHRQGEIKFRPPAEMAGKVRELGLLGGAFAFCLGFFLGTCPSASSRILMQLSKSLS
ncbi:MAG: 1-acyl-sn-glycerol-3-phosphate acyltransferase [Trueperaceae bacterium]